MKKIVNTAKDENHPEWTRGQNPDAIIAQEKRGQGQLINSTQLPVRCNNKEKLEKAGVVFGEPLADDPLFCEAILPNGWKKQTTEHNMWSDLLDAEGNVQANIFYKAAFYDRDAFISVV